MFNWGYDTETGKEMIEIKPEWSKQEERDWKYGGLPRPGKIVQNQRTSNIGVLSFETGDDEATQKVLDDIGELLIFLKKDRYPDLVWNASEAQNRSRWTRFQMVFDK